MHLFNTTWAILLLVSTNLAHPGQNVAEEAIERAAFVRRDPRSIRSCAGHLKARGIESASLQRRKGMFDHMQSKWHLGSRNLLGRDFAEYNISHLSTGSSKSMVVSEDSVFADNTSCILQPEVTQGPYYVNGELIRENITDNEEGIPMTLYVQLIDTSSCEPVPETYVDLWHCNSTGVYSGVVANGNGNMNDTSNLDTTHGRGIQRTDKLGVVQFQTLFPGHYTGRATHVHVMSHSTNGTSLNKNGTLLGANATTVHASHVGQIFFDQGLIAEVDTIYPYSENTQQTTLNSDDSMLGEEADSMDPFAKYMLVGGKIEDGIFAWITIGIAATQSNDITSAATLYETGGVENENSGMGVGGSPRGNGTGGDAAPSGSAVPAQSTNGA